MATKQSALAALKAHRAKPVYSEQLSSLDSVRKFVENCYPRLQVEDVHISDDPEADGSRWVIVCTTKFSDIGDGSGPVKPARMVELELATQIFARSKRGNISDVRLQYSTARLLFLAQNSDYARTTGVYGSYTLLLSCGRGNFIYAPLSLQRLVLGSPQERPNGQWLSSA